FQYQSVELRVRRQRAMLGDVDEPDARGIDARSRAQAALRNGRVAGLERELEARVIGAWIAWREGPSPSADDAARDRRKMSRADGERIGMIRSLVRTMQQGRCAECRRR